MDDQSILNALCQSLGLLDSQTRSTTKILKPKTLDEPKPINSSLGSKEPTFECIETKDLGNRKVSSEASPTFEHSFDYEEEIALNSPSHCSPENWNGNG
jgi:hypothetical protein